MFKNKINNILINLPIHPNPYLSLLENKEWKRVSTLIPKTWPKHKSITAHEIRQLLKSKNKNEECHIIASGASVLNTFQLIPDDSVIIGFNLASLLDIKYDIYFIESVNENFQLQEKVILGNKKIDKLIIKNIWQGKINLEYLEKKYSSRGYYLTNDILIKYSIKKSNSKIYKNIVNQLIKPNNVYLKQKVSTSIVALTLAIQSGFRKVIIHGLDLGGPYFFHDSRIKWPDAISEEEKKSYITKTSKVSHTKYFSQMEPLLVEIKKQADSSGVEIFAASKNSRSSIFLGHWKKD